MIKFICFLIKVFGFQIDWFEIIFVVPDVGWANPPSQPNYSEIFFRTGR